MSDKKTALHNDFVVSILRTNRFAADFLSNYVPEATAARIDWTRLTCEATACATDSNKVFIADLIFSAPFKDSDENASFFVLLEHKSDVEKTLPLQLLKYIAIKINDFAANKTAERGGRWPCPVALVLYNGVRPWTNPPTLRDVLYTDSDCADCVPDFKYFLVDLASTNFDELKGGPMIRIFLELLKRSKSRTIGDGLSGLLRPLADEPWDLALEMGVKSCYNYIGDSVLNYGEPITLADLAKMTADIKNEKGKSVMKNFVEELFERGVNSARERVAASESARFVQERFGDSISPELFARIEAINYYPTLEEIRRLLFTTKDAQEFVAAVEPLLK